MKKTIEAMKQALAEVNSVTGSRKFDEQALATAEGILEEAITREESKAANVLADLNIASDEVDKINAHFDVAFGKSGEA